MLGFRIAVYGIKKVLFRPCKRTVDADAENPLGLNNDLYLERVGGRIL